jgi:hypothetical protein
VWHRGTHDGAWLAVQQRLVSNLAYTLSPEALASAPHVRSACTPFLRFRPSDEAAGSHGVFVHVPSLYVPLNDDVLCRSVLAFWILFA